MNTRVEIESDLIRFDGKIVARIAPNLTLGAMREFEEWLEVGSIRERSAIIEDAKEKARGEHESKPTLFELQKALFEAIEPIFQHNVGLATRAELQQAFKTASDELNEPDR